MTESLFDRVVIPVASVKDAERTCKAALAHLRHAQSEVHVVNVIEHTEGYMDTASTEQLEQDAEDIFDAARKTFANADFTAFETHPHYGTDVTETVSDACEELDATAIVFVTRRASRWKRLLTGDVAQKLVRESPYPTVVLPDPDSESEAEGDSTTDSEANSADQSESAPEGEEDA
jgi:nucleotide-binding universal stress UspA family protein